MMTIKLFVSAMAKFLLGVALVGILVFLPAGTMHFWNGWLLMGILFVPMFLAGVVMMCKNPHLLKNRLEAKETRKTQDIVVKLSGLMFILEFVLAGLGFRFGWYSLPSWAVWVAAGAFLLAYVLYAEVMRENTYLSRTIKVEEGQTVVDTGMYAVVRHPMYSVTLLLFLMIPLVLGSWYSLIAFAFYPAIIIVRLKDEEELLTRELKGYAEYKEKVKYRLIPFIW